jgi:hypothetical protein
MDEKISLKEIYGKVIALEAKFDMMNQESKQTNKQFVRYALIIIIISVSAIIENALLHVLVLIIK